jgi:hypothetical protein
MSGVGYEHARLDTRPRDGGVGQRDEVADKRRDDAPKVIRGASRPARRARKAPWERQSCRALERGRSR